MLHHALLSRERVVKQHDSAVALSPGNDNESSFVVEDEGGNKIT